MKIVISHHHKQQQQQQQQNEKQFDLIFINNRDTHITTNGNTNINDRNFVAAAYDGNDDNFHSVALSLTQFRVSVHQFRIQTGN